MKKERTILLLSHYEKMMGYVAQFLHKKGVKKIAYIIDAKKPRLEREPDYTFKEKAIFEKEGFEVELIDLESSHNLEERFASADAIYVKGGNTFYLLNAMRKSGFDKMVDKLLDSGIIYIGESAGSYVTCPSIEMAHWKHQDADIVGLNDLSGLNLVSFLVTVHYKPEFGPIIQKEIKKSKYEVKILTDNQAILIENGKERLIEV